MPMRTHWHLVLFLSQLLFVIPVNPVYKYWVRIFIVLKKNGIAMGKPWQ